MDCAFELKDVLDEFFVVRKRSPTLFGDAPLRAVQACPPYCEGSGYGFQLSYPGVGLAISAADEPRVQMLDELAPGFDYAAVIESLAEQGFLRRDSSWFARLRQNWWWVDNVDSAAVWVWTGLLVRARPGFLLRVTELFNAPQLQADIDELLYAESREWQPLCLKIRLRGTSACVLRGAIASLGILDSDAKINIASINDCPLAGARDVEYYDPAYYEAKLTGKPTKKYARLRRSTEVPESITESPKVLVPHEQLRDAASISQFTTIDGADSFETHDSTYAIIRAGAAMRCRFLGRSFQGEMGPAWFEILQAVRTQWRTLYGEAGERCLYDKTQGGETAVHATPGPPALVLNIEPLLKFAFPPGWCALFEAERQGTTHGLRGLIAADRFHSGVFAVQCFDTPESFELHPQSVLGRVIALRQTTVDAGFQRTTDD